MNALTAELHRIYDQLESKQFGWFPDMDGSLDVYVEPDEEAQLMLQRGEMLVDLLSLRTPLIGKTAGLKQTLLHVELGTDWALLMWMHQCPCPGVDFETGH